MKFFWNQKGNGRGLKKDVNGYDIDFFKIIFYGQRSMIVISLKIYFNIIFLQRPTEVLSWIIFVMENSAFGNMPLNA